MTDEEFTASIKARIADHRSRHGKQAQILHLLGVDEIVRLVQMVERKQPMSSKSVARMIGVAGSTVCKFRKGEKPNGREWPELAAALAEVRANPLAPSTAVRKARAKRAAETRRKGARKVVAWADVAGNLHDTEAKALAATRRAQIESKIRDMIHMPQNIRECIIEHIDDLERAFK